MSDLSLEERTIGYVLRMPFFDGAAYGRMASTEMLPFLERPEDFQIVKSMSSGTKLTPPGEEPFLDLAARNPFLDGFHYWIAKFLLQKAAQNEFSVAKGLLQSSRAPGQLATPLEVNLYRLGASPLIVLFRFYHLLGAELGIADQVKAGMTEYFGAFSRAVTDLRQRHVDGKESFSYEELDLIVGDWRKYFRGDKRDEMCQRMFPITSRTAEQQILINCRYLEELEPTLDLASCRSPTVGPSDYPNGSLLPGNQHLLKTLAVLKPESLKQYVEKYRFNLETNFLH